MDRRTAEQHLFASSRDYWSTFRLRMDGYNDGEVATLAKALADCAVTLARRLGHRADNYLFGGGELTAREATDLLGHLRRLHDHAYASDFQEGVTAIYALKAIASVVLAMLLTERESVRIEAASVLLQYRDVLAPLVDGHRAASG